MSDPALLERYCSSYYDKHGLYNDGFPCPSDKYCCQNVDGTKMCCPITKQPNELLFSKKYASSSQPSQTVSSSTQSNLLKSTLFNKLSPQDSSTSSNSLVSSVSSWPFLVTNSTLLMSICAVLGLLVIISLILLIIVCKRCLTRKNRENQMKKININNQSSSSGASSSISPYSRNSSSSCTSTTVTSTSPKTNEITVCCEEEDDEHQKILTIDPNSGSSTSSSSTINSNMRNVNLMLSNRSSNLSDLLHSHRNTFSHHQTYMNAISSGSSSTALLLNNNSGNTTHTSFSSGSNTNFNQTPHAHLNFNENELHFDEQDEPDDDRDFIVTTTSNLEFLKSQSLFNSTPLNYYPSLKPLDTNQFNADLQSTTNNPPTSTTPAAGVAIATAANNVTATPTTATTNPTNSTNATTTSTSQINLTSSALGDYRFSTFLPTIYTKHVELI